MPSIRSVTRIGLSLCLVGAAVARSSSESGSTLDPTVLDVVIPSVQTTTLSNPPSVPTGHPPVIVPINGTGLAAPWANSTTTDAAAATPAATDDAAPSDATATDDAGTSSTSTTVGGLTTVLPTMNPEFVLTPDTSTAEAAEEALDVSNAFKATKPVPVGLDLVFPVPDQAYLPTSPFPLVFALRNADIIWPYGPELSWNLSVSVGNATVRTPIDAGVWGRQREGFMQAMVMPSPSILLIQNTKAMRRLPSKAPAATFTLDYSFRLQRAPDGYTVRAAPSSFTGSVNFVADNKDGIVPNIADSVSTTLGTISLRDINFSPDRLSTSSSLSTPVIPTNSTADAVATKMLQVAGCPQYVWPRVNNLTETCGTGYGMISIQGPPQYGLAWRRCATETKEAGPFFFSAYSGNGTLSLEGLDFSKITA